VRKAVPGEGLTHLKIGSIEVGVFGDGDRTQANTEILAFDFAQARMTIKNRQLQKKQIPFGNDKQRE
jgi:hypothetical protein